AALTRAPVEARGDGARVEADVLRDAADAIDPDARVAGRRVDAHRVGVVAVADALERELGRPRDHRGRSAQHPDHGVAVAGRVGAEDEAVASVAGPLRDLE